MTKGRKRRARLSRLVSISDSYRAAFLKRERQANKRKTANHSGAANFYSDKEKQQ